MPETVVLDADFIRAVLGYQNDGYFVDDYDSVKALSLLREKTGKEFVIHKYVFDYELNNLRGMDSCLQEAKEKGLFRIVDFSEYITSANQIITAAAFAKLFKHANASSFPPDLDFRAFHSSGCSLGEIHSLQMAHICGYGYFFSNDSDSLVLENEFPNNQKISIMPIEEVLIDLRKQGNEMPLKMCKVMLRGRSEEKQNRYLKSR